MYTTLRFVFAAAVLAAAALFHVARADSGALHATDAGGSRLEVASLDTTAELEIHGLVAQVRVKQRFRNDGARWQQGEYVLPLPAGAAVHAMTLRVGNRLIVGEIREKDIARSEFAQAVATGRKASLVEAQSANLFRTAIANVAPGETVEVEVGYWQQVDFRDGAFSIVFPLTYTPRYGAAGDPAAVEDADAAARAATAAHVGPPTVVITATLDAGVPLARVESGTHALAIRENGRRYAIRLADDVVAADRDFVLRWTPKPSATPTAALLREHAGDEQFALLMLLPPTQPAAPLPRELILVIDTSGSMEGKSIVQARAALDLALQRLTPRDRFNVIQFNSVTTPLFDRAVEAAPKDVALARDWVAQLRATGGTEMLPALELALRDDAPSGYLRQIVFATDGAVEQADALYQTMETQLRDSRLFPVGIGSAPNAQFLRKAGELGRGSSLVIRDLDAVDETMEKLFAKLDRPAVRDLQLNLPAQAEIYPQRLPDLYHGEPLLAIAKLSANAASGRAQVEGQLAGAAWSQPLSLDLRGNAQGLGRLWAQRKIEAIEDAMRRGGDESALRGDLVAVALRYHLVSRYTSLVAVDRTPQRPADEALEQVAVDNALPDGSVAFAQTATSSKRWLALGLLALLLGFALRERNGALR
ncbi:MAG TPA: marine proteobacterial sortase target protein [Tahibacter sp.]|uniref:marine proteobacterial sortase target protein n=1 Tax=Tahibacter sp. TaxID=2056211 RepID=UPI002C1E461E|nr:marine proteobacterial sortase target protein [Tahibacter sp.]HSX61967.1 marine proteobacterial sortase target protein [Tahibacter sp.]